MEYSLNIVIMPILMSLSAHFHISVSSNMICLLIIGHIFLPLPISVIFHWMIYILICSLLGAGYMCSINININVNVLQLCSRMQLSCLKTIWSSCVLLLWFARWLWHSAGSRANFAPLLRQEHPEYATQCPMNSETFQAGWWKEPLFLAQCEHLQCFL